MGNELCEHNLPTGETKEQLLNERGNSVSFWQADYSNLRPQLDGYQVIVVDFRHKDAAQHLFHLSTKLQAGGLLLLGSIDDVSGAEPAGPLSSLVVLDRLFTRMHCDGALESYPHIYKETRNKHQYAISHFSAWRKKEDAERIQLTAEEEERLIHYSTTTAQYYEDKSILISYDRFHFGPGLLGVKNFPQRMAEVCVSACRRFGVSFEAAMDAGCGPGGTALQLCEDFKLVEAYDYSQGFVDMMLAKKKLKSCKSSQIRVLRISGPTKETVTSRM